VKNQPIHDNPCIKKNKTKKARNIKTGPRQKNYCDITTRNEFNRHKERAGGTNKETKRKNDAIEKEKNLIPFFLKH
jgi:hypothetical protein